MKILIILTIVGVLIYVIVKAVIRHRRIMAALAKSGKPTNIAIICKECGKGFVPATHAGLCPHIPINDFIYGEYQIKAQEPTNLS